VTALSIYLSLLAGGLQNELQYRVNFVLMLAMGLVYQLTGAVFVWVVLTRFDAIAGWTLGEVAFLYGMRLIIHGLQGLAGGRLANFEWLVRQGEFDRVLVRPLSPLLQVMSSRFNVNQLGDLIGGVVLFVAANSMVDVDWSPAALGYLALVMVGGCLIELALQLVTGALVFRFMSVGALSYLIDDVFNNFGNYPLSIFGGGVRFLLTFGLPLAFVAYFPSTVLLRRTEELTVHPALAYGAPLVGVVWFAAGYALWRWQMRSYQSAGH
jgi:ABC-2 type transport system permease protein